MTRADSPGDGRLPLDRAEELVDRAAADAARFTLRVLARAREEAEDIWAEAEALRGSGSPSAAERSTRFTR